MLCVGWPSERRRFCAFLLPQDIRDGCSYSRVVSDELPVEVSGSEEYLDVFYAFRDWPVGDAVDTIGLHRSPFLINDEPAEFYLSGIELAFREFGV